MRTFVCAALMFVPALAAARGNYVFPTAETSRNTLTLSPPWPLHPDVVGEVQVRLHPRWALTSGVTIRSEWTDAGEIGAVTVDAGIRYFLLGTAPRGLWVGPYVGGGLMEGMFAGDGLTKHSAIFRGGLLVGGTWVPFWRLVLSLGVGGAYEHVKVEDKLRVIGDAGFTPILRASVGVTF